MVSLSEGCVENKIAAECIRVVNCEKKKKNSCEYRWPSWSNPAKLAQKEGRGCLMLWALHSSIISWQQVSMHKNNGRRGNINLPMYICMIFDPLPDGVPEWRLCGEQDCSDTVDMFLHWWATGKVSSDYNCPVAVTYHFPPLGAPPTAHVKNPIVQLFHSNYQLSRELRPACHRSWTSTRPFDTNQLSPCCNIVSNSYLIGLILASKHGDYVRDGVQLKELWLCCAKTPQDAQQDVLSLFWN